MAEWESLIALSAYECDVSCSVHCMQMNSASHRHYPAYHTVVDNSDYMERFIDPSFSAHVSLTQLAADVVLQMSSLLRLPLDVRELADTLELEYDSLQQDGLDEFNYLLGVFVPPFSAEMCQACVEYV